MFSREIYDIFQNTYFEEHLRMTASEIQQINLRSPLLNLKTYWGDWLSIAYSKFVLETLIKLSQSSFLYPLFQKTSWFLCFQDVQKGNMDLK